MADVIPRLILIENKVFVLFVDGVVSQVHAEILKVTLFGLFELFRGEAGEAFSVDENFQRVDTFY